MRRWKRGNPNWRLVWFGGLNLMFFGALVAVLSGKPATWLLVALGAYYAVRGLVEDRHAQR